MKSINAKPVKNSEPKEMDFPKSSLALAVTLAAGLLPAGGYAEEPEYTVMEEVVVTGSNIRRARDYETPSPIQTVDANAIQAAGVTQVQDILKILPANSGSEVLSPAGDRQGTSQFSLRGLGVGGTLTLINGRRGGLAPVTTTQGFFYTDINQYPTNMIQSVEVLLDGASATYGSEAVGGVVNIITRKNFEGFEIGTKYEHNEDTPGKSYDAAFGSEFQNGKGHFSAFITHYTNDRSYRGDYDWLVDRSDARSTDASANLFDSAVGAGQYTRAVDPDSDGIYERTGNSNPDANCGSPNGYNGVVNTFVGGTNCRYMFIDQVTMVAEQNRTQFFSQFDYDLSDKVNIFAEAGFSRNEVTSVIGGALMNRQTDDGGFYVPGSHPFNYFVDDGTGSIVWDEAAVAADPSLAVDVIFQGRPLTTFDGNLAADVVSEFDNIRLMTGFDAQLSDQWSFYTSYVYANSKFTVSAPRSYNAEAFRAAIGVGLWNPFGIAWADPNAVSVKDGVTIAGNTLDGLDSDLSAFAANRTFVKQTTQEVYEAILSGDAFELPNGNLVTVALGGQYRKTDYSDIADSLATFQLDGFAAPVFSIIDSSQDVYAIFGEANVPVTDDLEMQLAVRYEDYGSGEGGDTTDPKLGLRYRATDWLQFRGSVGTSFQAPSIRNIAGSVGAGVLADPILAGVYSGGSGSACNSGMTDSFNATQITTGGELEPQSAINWNIGSVFQTDRFTGSIDYWSYEFEDLIGPGESFGSIVAGECADTNGDGIGDTYISDSRVKRNAEGQLIDVTTSFINLGKVETDGIDISGSYYFDDVLGGLLTFSTKATYINSFDIDLGDGSPVFDGAGNRNTFIDLLGSVPDLKLNIGVDWSNESHRASLLARHIGSYDDREPGGIEHEPIGSYTVFDLNYGYAFDWNNDSTTEVAVGVNNLTDKNPPAIDRNSNNGRMGFDDQVVDPRGRMIYVTLKHSM